MTQGAPIGRELPLNTRIGMLRQWLNEDRIKNAKYFVTNEDIEHWLHLNDYVAQEVRKAVENERRENIGASAFDRIKYIAEKDGYEKALRDIERKKAFTGAAPQDKGGEE